MHLVGFIIRMDLCSQAVWHIPLLCVQWKTPDDGQRNCPKHVEFYSKNKFEILVRLVSFIMRIYRDARPPERQNCCWLLNIFCFRWCIILLRTRPKLTESYARLMPSGHATFYLLYRVWNVSLKFQCIRYIKMNFELGFSERTRKSGKDMYIASR